MNPVPKLRFPVARTGGRFHLCLLLAPALLGAQAADEIFELSPFVVDTSRDRGYTASASLAGGRLATDLRDTAAAVTVFTPELLADLGVTTFLEAARWAPNSVPQEEIESGNLYNDYAVSFRGMGKGFQARNYFRWYINSDAFSTERIEFARGPNSLVFGDAGVGGVANVSSKQARGTGAVTLEAQASSFGGARVSADADLKAAGWAAVRVAGVYQDFDDWRDVGGDEREGAFITATLRPGARTTLRLEGEYGRLYRVITYNTLDQMTRWDGVTTNPGFIPPRGTTPPSLSRWDTDRLVYNSARPDWGIINLQGFAATSGTFGQGLKTEPQPGLPEFAVVPGGSYKFSLQAPNAGVRNPYWTTSVFLEQRVGDRLFLELAANYQEQERDITRWFFDQLYVEVNETLPDGSPNPYLGDIYGWARYWRNLQRNEVFDLRAAAAYLLESRFADQRLLLVAGRREDRFEDHNFEQVRVNGANRNVLAPVNRIFAYRYLSDGAIPVERPPELDPVSGIESRVAKTTGFFSEKPIAYLQAAASGSWFADRRLNTLVGVRRDNYRERVNDSSLNERDPVSNELLAFGPAIKTDDQDVTSYTASAVYHLGSRFSLSAGYSESFDPGSTARALDGRSLEPLINEGVELGLRFQLLDGRVVGGLLYYESTQENNRVGGQANAINGIWEILGIDASVQTGYQDRQSTEGKGWEFELTAQPKDNWRILFNIAFPKTSITDGYLDTRAYYSEHVGAWRSQADALEAAGQLATANSVRTRITAIETAIESVARGRRLDNTFDYTANLFTRYFFTEGALDGFSLGGGVNIRGKRLTGNQPGDPFAYIHDRGYSIFSLLLGYDREVGRGQLSLQLNVNNAFDREIVRKSSLTGFTVQDPRQFLLTARYTF